MAKRTEQPAGVEAVDCEVAELLGSLMLKLHVLTKGLPDADRQGVMVSAMCTVALTVISNAPCSACAMGKLLDVLEAWPGDAVEAEAESAVDEDEAGHAIN